MIIRKQFHDVALDFSNMLQQKYGIEIDDTVENNLWNSLPFKNVSVSNTLSKNIYCSLISMFLSMSIFAFILTEYYLQTIEKRNCDCSYIDKVKKMKYMIISIIIIWILVLTYLIINNTILSPLVTVGLVLLAVYIIYALNYFYRETYDCKCSISRIGSILGYWLLGLIFGIPALIYTTERTAIDINTLLLQTQINIGQK